MQHSQEITIFVLYTDVVCIGITIKMKQ